MTRATSRDLVAALVLVCSFLRAPAVGHAEISGYGGEQRLVLAHRGCALEHELVFYTAPDLIAATTVLGYSAAVTATLGVAIGLEVHGILGDGLSSLDPSLQESYLGPMITAELGAGWTAQAQVALGLTTSSDKTYQLTLTREL